MAPPVDRRHLSRWKPRLASLARKIDECTCSGQETGIAIASNISLPARATGYEEASPRRFWHARIERLQPLSRMGPVKTDAELTDHL